MMTAPGTPPRDLSTVGVVGLGTMGAGIAEVFARAGFQVVGVDVTDEAVERGRQHVQQSTGRAVKRGKISAQTQTEILSRVSLTSDMIDLERVGFVIEAAVENLEVKRRIFARLDDVVAPDAILATNTSSLSVTEISTASSRPERVLGCHFFNPAPVQPLVEIVRTVVTDPDVLADVEALVANVGKQPVVCGDRAGFIANSLLFGYLNHAVSMYESRYASREDIDAAMRIGCGYPMGPLALLDLIGLDTAHEILETMYAQSRDRLHAPAPILRQMVTAGLLGRKSGRGFYSYAGPSSSHLVPDRLTPSADDRPQMRRQMRTVGVVGTGMMAAGIVEVFATAGYEVSQVDRDRTELSDLHDVDLVVEAIEEDLAATSGLFRELDRVCRAGVVMATTTSSLAVISLAAATSRPQDVIGMHVVDLVPGARLVEAVSTVATAPEVTETIRALCEDLGQTAVSCRDRSGFIVNALLFPYLNDAVKMVEAGYATADDIDTAMTQGCALPRGPLELLDIVGTDVALTIQRGLYEEFREPGFSPAPLLRHLVTAGHLGRRVGRGFRDH